ncbi:MAG: type IV pilin protein [Solirubrobacteraceae bacterium]
MRRIRAEQAGFTMVELLVVILMIGVLAEIAIPSFLGQASKAHDAVAKSYVFTAETTIETYRTDHGSVCGADPSALRSIEPALSGANLLTVSTCSSGENYTLSVSSRSSPTTTFTLSNAGGLVQRSCSPAGQSGCRADGSW